MADDQCYKVSLMKAATFWPRAVMILGALAFGIAMSAKEPFLKGLVPIRARSQPIRRRRNDISIRDWRFCMASTTAQPFVRSRKRHGSIRNVRWRIGESPWHADRTLILRSCRRGGGNGVERTQARTAKCGTRFAGRARSDRSVESPLCQSATAGSRAARSGLRRRHAHGLAEIS